MAKHILLKSNYHEDFSVVEIGVDEAGRGALAGPVTVAACIMPHGFQHELIKDSKLLNEGQRADARKWYWKTVSHILFSMSVLKILKILIS